MFLHIGNGSTVREREIIGIFDLDNASVSPITRRFLAMAEKRGEVADSAGGGIPRSFVLSGENRKKNGEIKKLSVRLSLISTAGLKLRLNRNVKDMED